MNDKPIEIARDNNPEYSVIWLHGLGADGHDFSPVVDMLDLAKHRFILPHAPYQKVTVNNGHEMRAWYDIYGIEPDSEQDEVGIRQTQSQIEVLIEKELAKGVPSQKIVLAGFSQGGAIALQTALRYKKKLAGVIALSTYLPLKSFLATEKSLENQLIPIFMAHGTHDEVISLATSKLSLAHLQAEQYQVQWHEYPIAHSVSIEEIDEIRTFLLSIAE
ncbi:MAG: alpha/beta fold hydrolase [Methylophilaceae bacterium]